MLPTHHSVVPTLKGGIRDSCKCQQLWSWPSTVSHSVTLHGGIQGLLKVLPSALSCVWGTSAHAFLAGGKEQQGNRSSPLLVSAALGDTKAGRSFCGGLSPGLGLLSLHGEREGRAPRAWRCPATAQPSLPPSTRWRWRLISVVCVTSCVFRQMDSHKSGTLGSSWGAWQSCVITMCLWRQPHKPSTAGTAWYI